MRIVFRPSTALTPGARWADHRPAIFVYAGGPAPMQPTTDESVTWTRRPLNQNERPAYTGGAFGTSGRGSVRSGFGYWWRRVVPEWGWAR